MALASKCGRPVEEAFADLVTHLRCDYVQTRYPRTLLATPQTMVLARKMSMQGQVSVTAAKGHLEEELEDAAVETEAQNGGSQRHRRRRKGHKRARRLVEQQDVASKDGLKAFMLNYCLVLLFLVFPSTTNIVFTMLRPCRQIISPLPHGSAWMWVDYSIQVLSSALNASEQIFLQRFVRMLRLVVFATWSSAPV